MTTLKSNMLKKGKKGFTLTELAIVIAVIAILIAVLVPTFTSVITNAKKTAAAEDATHAITAYTLETYDSLPDGAIIKSGDYYLTVDGGTVSTDKCDTTASTDGMVAYVWGADTDSSMTSLTIYLPTSGVTQNVAEAIAQNYVDSLSDSSSIAYVGVEYTNNSGADAGSKYVLTTVVLTSEESGDDSGNTESEGDDEATYYYFSVTSGVVKYTSTAPDSSKYTLNNTTYTGVVYYTATQTANAG